MSPITSFPLSYNAFLSLATVDILNLRQEVGRGLKQGKMCCIYISMVVVQFEARTEA